MGNITKVYENGKMKIRYEYDALNRLVREDNKDLKRTEVYAYDNNGNRISSRRYGYTQCRTEELEEKEAEEKEIYSYDGDRLIGRIREENGQKEEKICVYDNLGNPTKYLVTKDTVSNNVRWSETRQLSYYGGMSFSYDVRGRRLQKGTKNYSYDREGRLLKQGEELEFLYDDKGVVGFVNAEGTYFYRKDILGNITGILDSDGKIVVRYRYDAWGNHVVLNPDGSENESSTFIGNINPFRYRGYYYDVETGLYYLKTRYYDPVVGRFITIDDVSYLAPDTINGLNLYAYCGNNPVMRVDHEGTSWWSDFWNSTIGKIVGTVLVVVAVAAVSILTAGVGTAISGALGGGFVASILGGAVGGAISGAVIGAGFSIVTQGLTNGYGNIDWSQVGTATIKGLISGAITGAVFGFIGASVRGIKILNASRKGLVIGKMGNFESAAKSMNLSYYNGLKGYRLVEKIFGKDLATKIGWAHNKAFVKSVMKLGGAIVDIGGELSGAYAKEVTLTAGYQYLIKLTQLLF